MKSGKFYEITKLSSMKSMKTKINMATTCASEIDEMVSDDNSINDSQTDDETSEVEFVPDEMVTKIFLRRTPASMLIEFK